MDKELIIQSSKEAAEIALLEDKNLVEYHKATNDFTFGVGDIYLGRIKKMMPGLNAAFVDIGHQKDGFLHYHDLGPHIKSFIKYHDLVIKGKIRQSDLDAFNIPDSIPKTGKITEVFNPNQKTIVQIVKEPISTKGPRLSGEISIAGRYLILIPFPSGKQVAISRKIKNREEQKRIRSVIEGIKPANFGVIVRTQAENQSVETLDQDLRNLLSKWDKLFNNLSKGNSKLLGEIDKTESLLRDLLNDSFNKITVDNKALFTQIKGYVAKIAPKLEQIIKLDESAKPLFEKYGVTNQIKSLFGKTANIGGGAYLVIEHTEALHVIDVNSGSKKNIDANQEETALKTNMEAVNEIARQLRLRDMGGIIVIDLIDMKSAANRKKVYDQMKKAMQNDRARHSILQISKFGLMQVTRQRVKPEIDISTSEVCPTCKGTGKTGATIVLADEIESQVEYGWKEKKPRSITIIAHPFLESYLKRGLISLQLKWMWKYKMFIHVKPDQSAHLSRYKILGSEGEELVAGN